MDTDQGYRGGLTIRRLMGTQLLPAEPRDRRVAREVCLLGDTVSH